MNNQLFHGFICFLFIFQFSANQVNFKDCNFTDFRYQNKYNLGKQDELNNTFQLMQGKINLQDIVYQQNSYINYTVSGINPIFTYFDSKQKAQIMGNDTIVIDGSSVEAKFNLNWIKKSMMVPLQGKVQVSCKSDQILFLKKLNIDKGFLLYKVSDYYNVTFKQNQCKILRYQPSNTSQNDLNTIRLILNILPDQKPTVKSELTEQIAKKYFYYLNNSLYNQKSQLTDHMIYEWKNPNNNQTYPIQYQVIPTGVDLQRDGLSFTFVTQIKDWDRWTCGATIPNKNLDVKKFGGVQQFISLSVYQNTLRYAIQQGYLDTDLNYKNWGSSMFQFYAGDLYQVFPYLASNYLANQIILGNCRTDKNNNATILPQQAINQLFVKTSHSCQLYIGKNTKILDFKINLYSHIQAKFQQDAKVNFYVKNFTFDVSYNEKQNYKINDYKLANSIMKYSLNNLIGIKTFGSGWPIFSMDYPHMSVMAGGYVVFYDISHVSLISSQN